MPEKFSWDIIRLIYVNVQKYLIKHLMFEFYVNLWIFCINNCDMFDNWYQLNL